MASSSEWGCLDVVSFAIGGSKFFRNQSRKILSSSWILHKLRHRGHSWMWLFMWVTVFWWQDNKISTPSSYLMGSWKYCRNMKSRSWNPSTWLVVAQCTTWLQHLWGCLGRVWAWSNHLQCYLMSTIGETSWCGFEGTPLPSFQTWECLREVWLEWEAKTFDGG